MRGHVSGKNHGFTGFRASLIFQTTTTTATIRKTKYWLLPLDKNSLFYIKKKNNLYNQYKNALAKCTCRTWSTIHPRRAPGSTQPSSLVAARSQLAMPAAAFEFKPSDFPLDPACNKPESVEKNVCVHKKETPQSERNSPFYPFIRYPSVRHSLHMQPVTLS